MSASCSICRHPNVSAVNAALETLEGTRPVADRFQLSRSSVDRHKNRCLVRSSPQSDALALIPEVTPASSRVPNLRGTDGPGRPCLMCTHVDRAEVDRALMAGEPMRQIARRLWNDEMLYPKVRMHARNCIPRQIKQAMAETNSLVCRPMVEQLNDLRELAEEHMTKIRADISKLDRWEQEIEDFKTFQPEKTAEYMNRFAMFSRHKTTVLRLSNETMGSLVRVLELTGKRTGEITNRTELVLTKHPRWGEFLTKMSELIAEIEDEGLAERFTDLLEAMEK